jgi:hypothetical protein
MTGAGGIDGAGVIFLTESAEDAKPPREVKRVLLSGRQPSLDLPDGIVGGPMVLG